MKKVFFVLNKGGVIRYFYHVIEELLKDGTQVEVHYLYGSDKKATQEIRDKFLPYEKRFKYKKWETKSIETSGLSQRLRAWVNFGLYFRKNHTSPHLKVRPGISQHLPVIAKLPEFLQQIFGSIFASTLFCSIASAMLKRSRINPRMTSFLQENKPDLIVASPLIMPASIFESEIIRAASELKIQSIFALASWDNLTTKATFHSQPDHYCVWNEMIAKEAVDIHRIRPEKITVTGAPTFDYLYKIKGATERQTFLRNAKLDPERPYLLFLGSSNQMTGNEKNFFDQIHKVFSKDDKLKDLQIMIRPHPLNPTPWSYDEFPNVSVFPESTEAPTTLDIQQQLYDSVFHSIGVLGINTSAFLESAIVDRPCISIISKQYEDTQNKIGHFQLLREGKFLYISEDVESAKEIILNLLNGSDPLAENRKQFVKDFTNPREDFKYASEAVAHEIKNRL